MAAKKKQAVPSAPPKAEKALKPAKTKKSDSFNPESPDAYAPTIQVNFETRAGLPNYARELEERLKDVEEETRKVFYQLPIKLSKGLYKSLLLEAIAQSKTKPYWTEQDQIEVALNSIL
jgi:hypothetical protein